MMLALLLIALVLALLSGYPAAFCLGGVSIVFGLVGYMLGAFDVSLFYALPGRLYGLMRTDLLIAIPLFVFMGSMLQKSGAATEMLASLNRSCRRLPCGLGVSVMLVGAALAASTGIVGATVVTMAMISLPGMLRAGYDPKLACGAVCAAGTLGQIIPPSIVLILLADRVSAAYQGAQMSAGNFTADPVSVSDVFAGALLPGLLLVAAYIVWMFILKVASPASVPDYAEDSECADAPPSAWKALGPPFLLIFAVLGSILGGLATATEAASVGAVGAVAIALCKGKFSRKLLWETSHETGMTSAMLFSILIGASIFSLVFRGYGGDDVIHGMLVDLPGGMYTALAVSMLLIFVLGFLLDFIEIIYIVVPVIVPPLTLMGADPVWIAVLIAVNLQTSFLTPPFGFSLFYLKSAAPKEIKIGDIYRGAVPFIAIQLLMLTAIAAFPILTEMRPGSSGGNALLPRTGGGAVTAPEDLPEYSDIDF